MALLAEMDSHDYDEIERYTAEVLKSLDTKTETDETVRAMKRR